jgi:hypothetical protein
LNVDLWGWFHAFQRKAIISGDAERRQLPEIYYRGSDNLEIEPEKALNYFEQGKSLAQRLGEPCWALFFDYWRCEAYMFYIDDYKTALDVAVRIAAEAHKSQYVHCPVRARVYRILGDAYLLIDPVGYADQIRKTIDYMEADVPMDDDTRLLLQGRRAILAFAFEQLDEAIDEGLRYFALSENHDYRYAYAAAMLCEFYYLKGEIEVALKFAQTSEISAHRADMKGLLGSLAAWRALFARKLGNEEEAGRFYRLATSRTTSLGRTPFGAYFEALAHYHEIGGESDKAVTLRRQEINIVTGRGSPFAECGCRLKRLRLFGRMGLPIEEEMIAAREAAKGLIDSSRYIAKLDRIAKGDFIGEFPNTL